MCNHVFNYPIDIKENYNSDGKTLTGICKHCGSKQKAYGMRWSILIEEALLKEVPYGESHLDKTKIIC